MRKSWREWLVADVEAAATSAPWAVGAMAAASLVGGLLEIWPLLLPPRGAAGAAPVAPLGPTELAIWIASLICAWTVFESVARHVSRRVVADQLEQRWADDLSQGGVARALDDAQGDSSRLLCLSLALLTAAAVLGWVAVVGFPIKGGGIASLLVSASVAALVFTPFEPLSSARAQIDRARLVAERALPKVADLRAIGAEVAAYQHLWRRFDRRPPLRIGGARLGRWVMRTIAAAALSSFGLSAAAARPRIAVFVGVVLLGIRTLLAGKNLWLTRVEVRDALSHVCARGGSQLPRRSDASAALIVNDLNVGGAGAEAPRKVTFQALLGGVTWIFARSETRRRLVIEVLLGLRQADHGRLELGGERPDYPDGRGWRTRCGLVPARTLIVRGTLRHNLLVSAPETAGAELLRVIIAASPEGTSSRLLGRLDERLGPDFRLTAAELRTVSFTRALLRRPELLIVECEPGEVSGADHFARLVRALSQRCILLAVTSSAAHPVQPPDRKVSLDL